MSLPSKEQARCMRNWPDADEYTKACRAEMKDLC